MAHVFCLQSKSPKSSKKTKPKKLQKKQRKRNQKARSCETHCKPVSPEASHESQPSPVRLGIRRRLCNKWNNLGFQRRLASRHDKNVSRDQGSGVEAIPLGPRRPVLPSRDYTAPKEGRHPLQMNPPNRPYVRRMRNDQPWVANLPDPSWLPEDDHDHAPRRRLRHTQLSRRERNSGLRVRAEEAEQSRLETTSLDDSASRNEGLDRESHKFHPEKIPTATISRDRQLLPEDVVIQDITTSGSHLQDHPHIASPSSDSGVDFHQKQDSEDGPYSPNSTRPAQISNTITPPPRAGNMHKNRFAGNADGGKIHTIPSRT